MNEQQLEAMRQALEALESNRVMGMDSQGNYSIEITPAKTLYAITSLRATIEQAEQQNKRCPLCDYQHGHAIGCKNNPVDIALAKLAAAQPALKPLTRKQIDDLADEGCFLGNIYEITQAIESAHGITGETK